MKTKELDNIALIRNLPAYHLKKGDVGTVVENLDKNTVEVEFTDKNGKTTVLLPLSESDFIRLNITPTPA